MTRIATIVPVTDHQQGFMWRHLMARC